MGSPVVQLGVLCIIDCRVDSLLFRQLESCTVLHSGEQWKPVILTDMAPALCLESQRSLLHLVPLLT